VKDRYTAIDMQPFGHLKIMAKPALGPTGFGFSPGLLAELLHLAPSLDVLHSHTLWSFPHWTASLAPRPCRPLVIAPHGALDPWALDRPRLRKRLAWVCFDKKALAKAGCLQALSGGEAAALRRLGLKAPIALLPNGIHPADYDHLPPPWVFTNAFPPARDRRILLFLSRLHLKKGLVHLLTAWAEVAKDHPEWLLVIAGPDDNGFQGKLLQMAETLGTTGSLLFTGPLDGPLKLAALNVAEALVLPSFSEGFTITLLEALACRRPILITPQCYFPEAIQAGAGVSIPAPTVPDTVRGLRDLLALSDRDRREMGRQGRALVEAHYTWEILAQKTVRLYHWLLGGGPRPAFVEPST
jgi:glycosyltransferase involved in cell wall biosynthesis